MKKLLSKIKKLYQKDDDDGKYSSDLEYYANRHLENDEKWKLLFMLMKKWETFETVEEFVPVLIKEAQRLFSVDDICVVLYSGDLKNSVFSMKQNEEMEFLKRNIFFSYRFSDALLDLRAILKQSFLLLPIRKTENEYGYIFLRFKNVAQMADDSRFFEVLCEYIAFVSEQLAQKKMLKEETRQKSILFAEFFHELKNSLNTIVGYSDLLKEGIHTLSPKNAESVLLLSEGARQLQAIMLDLIESTKLEHGKMRIRSEYFSTSTAIDRALDVFSSKIAEKAIVVERILLDISIESDPTKFYQVMYNLVSNAVKFSPYGGVIRVLSWCDNGNFHFEISDQGCGMREDELKNLFTFLGQANSSISLNKDGSGIGLSFCKKVVEMQGGEIKISSKVDEGSTLSFYLPVS